MKNMIVWPDWMPESHFKKWPRLRETKKLLKQNDFVESQMKKVDFEKQYERILRALEDRDSVHGK